MNKHEKVTQFKYAIRNLKGHVKDGNQLCIELNGQLVAVAQYDDDLKETIIAVLDNVYKQVDKALRDI